jgi:radical SAM superfamily enzyme YgiQ (UPF0313 family)
MPADIAVLNSSLGIASRGVPVGPLMITAVLQEHGFTVNFRDYQTASGDHKPSIESFTEFMSVPESIIGISVMCTALPTVLGAISRFKSLRPDTIIILGGPSATDSHREIVQSFPVDIIVRGEGEATIVDVVHALRSGGSLGSVRGITYREAGRVICTADRPRINDLDSLPLPAYEHIEFADYGRRALIITSRGCPYHCAFCSAHSIWQRRMTYRSAEHVRQELQELRGRIDRYDFYDDTFVLDEHRAIHLIQLIWGSGIRLPWSCGGRINHTSSALLTALRDFGCQEIFYGVESGSDLVLERIGKKFTSREAEEAVLKSARFLPRVHTSYVWGFPYEDMEDFFSTLLLLTRDIRLPNVDPQITMLTPLPASPLAQEYAETLRFSLHFQRGISSLPSGSLDQCPDLAQLIEAHPKIFTSYYYLDHPDLEAKRSIIDKLARNVSTR